VQSRACMTKTMLGGTCKLGASRTRWQKQEPSPSLTRLRHVSARLRAGGGRLIPFVPAHCILLRLIPPPLRFRLHFIASAPFHSAVQNCDETAGRPARKKAAREPAARARPSISTASLRHGSDQALSARPDGFRLFHDLALRDQARSTAPKPPGQAGPAELSETLTQPLHGPRARLQAGRRSVLHQGLR